MIRAAGHAFCLQEEFRQVEERFAGGLALITREARSSGLVGL